MLQQYNQTFVLLCPVYGPNLDPTFQFIPNLDPDYSIWSCGAGTLKNVISFGGGKEWGTIQVKFYRQ
jgi:hypothetical protein